MNHSVFDTQHVDYMCSYCLSMSASKVMTKECQGGEIVIKRMIGNQKRNARSNMNGSVSGAAIMIVITVVFTILLAGMLYVWTTGLADTDCGSERAPDHYPYSYPAPTYDYNPPNDAEYANTYFKDYGTNPFISTEDDRVSTFAMDVDRASYSVSRSYIESGSLPPEEAVRVEEFINYFDHEYSSSSDTFNVHLAGSQSRFGDNNKHMLMIGIKGKDASMERMDKSVITVVVDTSGSMDMENRLGLVKKSLNILLDNLQRDDKVGLVTYGSSVKWLIEPTCDIPSIQCAINSMSASGSTNVYEGLTSGYDMANSYFQHGSVNKVILCSDGVANTGPTGWEDILNAVRSQASRKITLTTVGFGMENYNDELMEQLADNGDGCYYYVDSLQEADRIFSKDIQGTLVVIARDAKVQVDFNPDTVERYRLLGYENRQLDDEDFTNDRVDGGEIGSGHSVTALYEIRLSRETGNIGEVKIRYKNPGNDRSREISAVIPVRTVTGNFDDAPADYRFTCCVAQFAEILRDSYWARGESLDDVLEETRAAVDDMCYHESYQNHREFEELVLKARNISRWN